jgi:hypothetical protein
MRDDNFHGSRRRNDEHISVERTEFAKEPRDSAWLAAYLVRRVLGSERYRLILAARMNWTRGHAFQTSDKTELHKLNGTVVLAKGTHIVCPHTSRAVGSL